MMGQLADVLSPSVSTKEPDQTVNLEPPSEHQLLVFWVIIQVLGELSRRGADVARDRPRRRRRR